VIIFKTPFGLLWKCI